MEPAVAPGRYIGLQHWSIGLLVALASLLSQSNIAPLQLQRFLVVGMGRQV